MEAQAFKSGAGLAESFRRLIRLKAGAPHAAVQAVAGRRPGQTIRRLEDGRAFAAIQIIQHGPDVLGDRDHHGLPAAAFTGLPDDRVFFHGGPGQGDQVILAQAGRRSQAQGGGHRRVGFGQDSLEVVRLPYDFSSVHLINPGEVGYRVARKPASIDGPVQHQGQGAEQFIGCLGCGGPLVAPVQQEGAGLG
nr:hypothetical protein [Brevundimonas diminuta]